MKAPWTRRAEEAEARAEDARQQYEAVRRQWPRVRRVHGVATEQRQANGWTETVRVIWGGP